MLVIVQDRKPFAYRDKVVWSEVAGLLNGLFISHTGRSLPEEQLDYLATIALSRCQITYWITFFCVCFYR